MHLRITTCMLSVNRNLGKIGLQEFPQLLQALFHHVRVVDVADSDETLELVAETLVGWHEHDSCLLLQGFAERFCVDRLPVSVDLDQSRCACEWSTPV